MTLSDRIVVLDSGVAQQVGPPLELYRRPANAFVATFLGTPTMALLPAPLAGSAAPAGAEQVGARPHDARARRPSQPVAADAVRLGEIEIEIVERLGQESFAFGRLPGAPTGAERVGALVEDDDVKPGAQLAIDIAREKLHFFDAQGRRLG
jgi:ABC-type sugar transport system ATPase subunit